MARIEVTRSMPHPAAAVWSVLADLEGHAGWMWDARSIRFIGPARAGVGTRMAVETRIGPLRTVDVLEVTGWEEGRSIEVAHHGLVRGSGRLFVEAASVGSLVGWVEDLRFPWWLGGRFTAWLASPVLKSVWRSNLRRLEARVSSP